MSNINQLAALDTLSGGDQIPVFSIVNGDARRISISSLVEYFRSQMVGSSNLVTQYATPTATGFSVAIAPITPGVSMYLFLAPNAGYAAGTVVLPPVADSHDEQEVLVFSTQSIAALTVNGNGAMGVNGAPTALAPNGFFRLRFDQVLRLWNRIG